MYFVLISAPEVHYGPTIISTEDGHFHEQIGNELTLSMSKKQDNKSEKSKQKLEAKMKDTKPDKAEKMKAQMDKLLQRKSGIVSLVEGKSVKFDPSSKSYIIKVDESPVKVLNTLAKLGFQVVPSSSGSSLGHFRDGHVWTLYRHAPPPAYSVPSYPNIGGMQIH